MFPKRAFNDEHKLYEKTITNFFATEKFKNIFLKFSPKTK